MHCGFDQPTACRYRVDSKRLRGPCTVLFWRPYQTQALGIFLTFCSAYQVIIIIGWSLVFDYDRMSYLILMGLQVGEGFDTAFQESVSNLRDRDALLSSPVLVFCSTADDVIVLHGVASDKLSAVHPELQWPPRNFGSILQFLMLVFMLSLNLFLRSLEACCPLSICEYSTCLGRWETGLQTTWAVHWSW